MAVRRFRRKARGYWQFQRCIIQRRILATKGLAERENLPANPLSICRALIWLSESDWDSTALLKMQQNLFGGPIRLHAGSTNSRDRRTAAWQVCLWYENELSHGRRLLRQLMRAARISERQALRDDRVNLATTKQLEQREEVFPEPIRVSLTRLRAWAMNSFAGSTAMMPVRSV